MVKGLAAAVAMAITFSLAVVLLVVVGPVVGQAAPDLAGGPSVVALGDIPPTYLTLYLGAARTCRGLPWGALAGIGKVESNHGRSAAPGVHSGANFAGAEGPMQFEPATFAQYATSGGRGGPLSPYKPADAVYTAAAVLCANGARSGTAIGIRRAVFAYNHSWAYVREVLAWAARYATPAPSRIAAAAIAFAVRQVGKPYVWGAAGPDAFDCSGLVFAAYAAAGVSIARTTFGWRQDGPSVPLVDIQPGDLLFSAGSDGSATNPGHVVMYLGGGQVIQAPQAGEDVQIDPLSLAGVLVATRPADLLSHF